ncbi:C-type lectin domain family 4 member M-like isoform X2 [Myxocyprinus asiaticus]|uniref:C-type lectin domain family 4 member M-like isoform X2 n=1 Tax=Myxocyprinus asiaticus TaxID=70543 RepID=UPI002221B877|nr:C-type lectin domain family 4 member M-like isoform X2 [Myxocyprinus asiaticus]
MFQIHTAESVYENINIDWAEEMKREDGEEMNIYINADTISSHVVRTETEDTKRHKTPHRTGSECVRNRNFRAATVCLGVLCVLLLTAVIVLCVQLFRKTRQDQFNTKNKNIFEEREQLLTNNTKLTEERDQLLNNNTNLTKERDGLTNENHDLTKQSEQFNQEKNELQKTLREMDGWIYYQFSFYYISSEIKSWNESRRYCIEKGADLMIINNTKKQDFLKENSGKENVWIGLTDSEKEGTWKWVNGKTLNSGFWRFGQPDGQRTENCALITSSELIAINRNIS